MPYDRNWERGKKNQSMLFSESKKSSVKEVPIERISELCLCRSSVRYYFSTNDTYNILCKFLKFIYSEKATKYMNFTK